jgi:aspartate 1-decarboxylase
MQIQVLKSKIHRVKVTGADLNYIGSITIDESFRSFNIIEGEKVIVNINNGERLKPTQSGRKFGTITLNGPAARKVQKRRYHYYFLCDNGI